MTTTLRRDAWHGRAACAGQDTDLWFPKQPTGSHAVQTCRNCPVRAECLLEALQEEGSGYAHRYGIRGGLTAGERRRMPPLPAPQPTALAALRSLLAALDEQTPGQPPTEGTTQQMTTADTPAAPQELITISSLLRWAEEHPDTEVQAQGARAEAALTGLRTRYAADQELTSITTEAEQLEKRLNELRAREAELTPKPKKKRGSYVRDYDTREVRAWATTNGIDCPHMGQIPKRVLDAWRASLPQTA
ncbi:MULTISPECIES: histone-like nucleoid-structuring protein Lsr2 [unclassified Streptomyces]|uniref:WhiB family transcriptional regulator n=1 Tax=unclassified Streptomyces TaxID=2593676 RepID=UPI002E2AF951|nr:histone-like nucleoid-structuring protein Lsr2 [Streptomyces sp. NBC_00228]